MDKLITIVCVLKNGEKLTFEISPNKTIQDLKEMIKKKIKCYSLDLYFKDKKLNPSATIFQSGLRNNDTVFVKYENYRNDELFCNIVLPIKQKYENVSIQKSNSYFSKNYQYPNYFEKTSDVKLKDIEKCNQKLIVKKTIRERAEKIEEERIEKLRIDKERREKERIRKEIIMKEEKEKREKEMAEFKEKLKAEVERNFIKRKETEEGEKEINIKFLKLPNKNNTEKSNAELTSLLKLCLLKEISTILDPNKLEKFPDLVKTILNILKNGYNKQTENLKRDIKIILEKVKGSNIINFSKFVDDSINSAQLNKLIGLLNYNQKLEISDIKNRLARYEKDIKIFDKQFGETLKDSIMEFSVTSVAIIEREDFEKFEKEKKKCPNRIDKLLFHGTGEEPVACIMTNVFKKSIKAHYQHGKGVYFSDMLDYCWFYGGKKDTRDNGNKIPKKDEEFTLIACSTYYDNTGFKQVYDYKYDPKKNEINFAYAGAKFETLKNIDKTKFYGTEYVIWELDQICPFIGAKLKRVEFCCIWRDI